MPFLTGGSCRATIIGGEGRDERLLMRERNIPGPKAVVLYDGERKGDPVSRWRGRRGSVVLH